MVLYDYTLLVQKVKRVTEVKDLGVYLDQDLSLATHIKNITARSYKMLGFLFRQSEDFKYPTTYIILYISYVHSILEYASTVCNPQYSKYIDMIERIQKNS